ncbi:outer membrane lipoprotein carrier protein LolA [Plantactinospora sp. GCM10030261]|uniref:LolA family protein n=1 Tax=Plantactinospora sp. GCM10030261 TaxID=3273420 RepID=UPI00360D5C4F
MSMFSNRPALRWLVPAAATVVVLGGGAAVGTFAANAEPVLPPRSAAQLLVDLQTAKLDGLSGTVVQRADLGLPALPLGGGQGEADLATLASGTHTLRVWYAGPEQQRVALLGTLGETDVIHNGRDVWVWASQRNEAVHRVLPEGAAAGRTPATELPFTPQQAAEQALAAVDPTTEVTVGRSAHIAGRDAYELVLGPRDTASLVGQVRIAIDSREHIPLRFEIFARGASEPAFEVAFTQVDFSRPDPAQFTFNPPPGTKIVEPAKEAPSGDDAQPGRPGEKAGPPEGMKTVGTGWTTVLVARDGAGPAGPGRPAPAGGGDEAARLEGLLGGVPKVDGDWGSGRLLSGKLFSVLLTDDGRLLAGLVTPERLYEVARTEK